MINWAGNSINELLKGFILASANASKSKSKDKGSAADEELEESSEVLPEGFFDDPKLDAKVIVYL